VDRLAVRLSAAALAIATTLPAAAQELARLHVRSFVMSVDSTSVRVGEPFHLTLEARVDEPTLALDNVTLPDLTGFESLGDERRCEATPRGSACSETVTLAANEPGDRTIAGATLDAVDARNGKPSRFTANAVAIHVAGVPPGAAVAASLASGLGSLVRAFVILALVLIAALGSLRLFAGRGRAPQLAPAVPLQAAIPAEPKLDPGAHFRALVESLRNAPTRAHAFAVREALRERLGAREGETLSDLLARGAAREPRTLAAMAAIEHATFCEEENVGPAVREALTYLSE
jgi:hypothetical protein